LKGALLVGYEHSAHLPDPVIDANVEPVLGVPAAAWAFARLKTNLSRTQSLSTLWHRIRLTRRCLIAHRHGRRERHRSGQTADALGEFRPQVAVEPPDLHGSGVGPPLKRE